MLTVLAKWRVFWSLWLVGVALFVFIVATNGHLATAQAPAGIIDHQSAATAARVNAIKASWRDAGVDGFATVSMMIDLVFIGIYALGGIVGSVLICRSTQRTLLWVFGKFTLCAYVLFALLDYVETIAELIQQISGSGNDALAALAATVRPIKMLALSIASLATIITLIWHRMERLRKPAKS